MAVTVGLMLALRGDNDGRNDDGSDAGALRWRDAVGVVSPGFPLPDSPQPTPVPTPAPAATPGPADGPEPSRPEPAADAAATDPDEAGGPAEQGEPQPEPAGTVDGVALTFYTCVGDSTGQYCGVMASDQTVHRGAAACGYAWELGTRFRILGDPYPDTIYTCLDRGGGPHLWADIWFHDATEGRAWRNHLPQYITVEMMP